LLQTQQREAFAALTEQLSTLTRDRAAREAALKHWQAEAKQALAQLQAACTQAASGEQDRSALAQALAAAQAVAAAAPAGSDATALHTAAATAQTLDERLHLLEQVLEGRPATAPKAEPQAEPAPAAESAAAAAVDEAVAEAAVAPEVTPADALEATAEAASEAALPATADAAPAAPAESAPAPRPPAPRTPAQQWKALPPLADPRLAGLLQARFEAWQRSQDEARLQQKAQRREQAQEHKQAVRTERAGALEAALVQAEARLAEGLVAETHKHLIEIDELLHAGAPADALRARIGRLQDGYAELRGWQHWAGGRARDDLTAEAEALAASCAPGPEGQPPKLQLKAHGELIESLWARWKELDRLGGAGSRALWQRFDAALKTAYEPLAAVKAAQSAAREQNLAARRQLLDVLEAVPLPAADEGSSAPADLRPAMHALDQFRVEWRKLGPLEHTVPRKAQDRLVQRMDAAVQRLHGPVDAARQVAQQERQTLIERAQALAAFAQAQPPRAAPTGPGNGPRGPGPGGPAGRDLVGEVRTLQAQWQQCAQALPLPRQLENALWTQFRTALDAVFSAREAAFSARDAEFKAHGDERQALIDKLEALVAALDSTPAAETKRTLADIDAQWQRCGPAPRAQAAALDNRFRRAREDAQQWLAGSRQRSWNATCDALAARLALCEAQEGGTATTPADTLAQHWATLPAVPAAWDTALQQRVGLAAPAAGKAEAQNLDAALLQLELAWNLNTPPAHANARRDLQLQAMKAALESRRSPAANATPQSPEQWLAQALRQPAQDDATRSRLAAVLAALRQRGPM
jgi:hypothetical protein